MSILVTGASGTIGSLVVQGLAAAGAQVRAFVRKPGKQSFPAGVAEAVGDLTDVASLRAALSSVRTLFLLNAVTPDEVTQALVALNLARDAGVERIVYLSVIHADRYTNVPHFTGRRMVAGMSSDSSMRNDLTIQQVIRDHGVYPMPIGSAGVAMVDTRDIADVAVAELLRRDAAPAPLPRLTLDLVGPEALTDATAATTWATALGREVIHGVTDLAAFEQQLASFGPAWLAYDMRLMMAGIQKIGMRGDAGAVDQLQAILGRPLRTYAAFVSEAVKAG